ncbi:MAG: hypothetical protein U1A77_19950 [Pirellulales bacterium]
MRVGASGLGVVLLAYLLCVATGCGSSDQGPAKATATKHDHDHAEHDHDGHDHGEHDHDGHSHGPAAASDKDKTAAKPAAKAESFTDAVAQLGGLHAKIRDGFEKNDVDSAHGPLHDVGHLLEQIPALAGKETQDAAVLEEVKKQVDELFDLYGKVDEKLHGEKGADYKDVAEKIDAAMEKLKKIMLPKANP